MKRSSFTLVDRTVDTTAGDDLVAALKLTEHLIVCFLAFTLRRDNQEPHTHKEQDDGQKLTETAHRREAACASVKREKSSELAIAFDR